MSARTARASASRTGRTSSSSPPAPTRPSCSASTCATPRSAGWSEDEQVAIDDSVRMISSPVFINLAGDDHGAVRAGSDDHIQRQHRDRSRDGEGRRRPGTHPHRGGRPAIHPHPGLHTPLHLLPPRRAGRCGPGLARDRGGRASNPPGPLRPALNEVITLAGSARDFVSWYEQALQGRFFTRPETLVEFKRIQAMSVQIPGDRAAGYARLCQGRGIPLVRRSTPRASLGRWWLAAAHAGDLLLYRELGRICKRFSRSRGRVLRGHQRYSGGRQARAAVIGCGCSRRLKPLSSTFRARRSAGDTVSL